MIIMTLAHLMAGSGEPMPDKPPVLIYKPNAGREYWRVWETALPKDVPSTKYRLIMKNGHEVP